MANLPRFNKRITSYCVLGLVAVGVIPTAGMAGQLFVSLTPYTGDAEIFMKLDDMASGLGNIEVTVDVISNPYIGDLRGVFMHIQDESLISGLTLVGGIDITQSVFGPADGVSNLGGGNVINGSGNPCGCDMGFEIGTPGSGMDDIQSTVFVIGHDTVDLNVSHFTSQAVGARVSSVGLPGGPRTESSKLSGVFVPEPSGICLIAGMFGCLVAGPWR